MFKVTRDWIRTHASNNGSGFTRDQLTVLGLWPTQKGWMNQLVGSEITDEQKTQFEALSGRSAYLAEKQRKADYDKKAADDVLYTWPDPNHWMGWNMSKTKPAWWDRGIDTNPATVPWE